MSNSCVQLWLIPTYKTAGCGVVGRAKALVVGSGNLGSSPGPSSGLTFFICEIRAPNQMLSTVSSKVSKVFHFLLLTIQKRRLWSLQVCLCSCYWFHLERTYFCYSSFTSFKAHLDFWYLPTQKTILVNKRSTPTSAQTTCSSLDLDHSFQRATRTGLSDHLSVCFPLPSLSKTIFLQSLSSFPFIALVI